jgi:hypothetical protein
LELANHYSCLGERRVIGPQIAVPLLLRAKGRKNYQNKSMLQVFF